MSSAILYLAIVAIWAVILVPVLVRRSLDGSGTDKNAAGPGAEADAGSGAVGAVQADAGPLEPGVAHPGPPDDDITEPVLTVRGRALWSEGPGWRSRRRDRPRPVVTRQAALRARRRMLTMLVTLALVALALTVLSLAPLWILVPPFAMLGLLALVLHEAAHADAEAAARRAETHAAQRARQARIAARRRAAEAARANAAAPEATAEIIDISARVTDQFYDQYADAAVRAVGD